jgi:hypothetical protein
MVKVRTVVILVITCLLAAACSGSANHQAHQPATASATLRAPPDPPRSFRMFGHIRSLTRRGRAYVMRFDPAWLLQGETARRAAVDDGVIPPDGVVTNDFYIREDGHKLLTFVVPGNAKVTVVTDDPRGPATPIHVFELARVVSGERPKRAGWDPRLGFWARGTIDTVRRLDQQYLPCPPECR